VAIAREILRLLEIGDWRGEIALVRPLILIMGTIYNLPSGIKIESKNLKSKYYAVA
jgi:hypothetical protein